MFKTINFYFQYSIVFLIIPLVIIYKELRDIDLKIKIRDAYISLFKYRERFKQYKKNLKEK